MTEPLEPYMLPENCTVAMLKLSRFLQEFQESLEHVRANPDVVPNEKKLCLKSRTAYFAVFDWAVIHDEIDEAIESLMRKLFEQAVEAMTDEKYRESVLDRFRSFDVLCKRVSSGDAIDSFATT